jgi:glycosyltransferase involved in cell wall biosynthesis
VVVGVLSTSYPRHAGDFAGCFVEDDARRRARTGATVEVVAAGAGPPGTWVRREGDLTVTRIGTGLWPPGRSLFFGDGAPEVLEQGGLSAWIQAGCFWAALCRHVAEASRRWDAIVSHWLLPCGLAAAAVAPSVPHRAYAHSGDVALLERLPFGRALARVLARSGARLVFVSEDLRLRFAALVGRDVNAHEREGEVEPLLPDLELFAPPSPEGRQAARRRLGVTRPTAIAVGRLVPIKGLDLLVDACVPDAAERGAPDEAAGPAIDPQADPMIDPVIDLVILGDGPERRSLQERARRRRVSLRLPGAVPRADVPLWLAAADVFVQPSRVLSSGRTEGLPMAALEALAMGVPVVASRSGGLAELGARRPEIVLFAAGDVRSLRRALRAKLAPRWPAGSAVVTFPP